MLLKAQEIKDQRPKINNVRRDEYGAGAAALVHEHLPVDGRADLNTIVH